MMFAVISILVITGAVWTLNKVMPFKVCPVCAGVSGTWIILTVLMLKGILQHSSDMIAIAMLMGGTVVGIAYQGEKVLLWPKKWPVLWKLMVMAIGFPAAYYSVQHMSWVALIFEFAVLTLLVYIFFVRHGKSVPHVPHRTDPADVQDLEKKLESCC